MTPEQEAEQKRIWAEEDRIKAKLEKGEYTKQDEAYKQDQKAVDAWHSRFKDNVKGRLPDNHSGN